LRNSPSIRFVPSRTTFSCRLPCLFISAPAESHWLKRGGDRDCVGSIRFRLFGYVRDSAKCQDVHAVPVLKATLSRWLLRIVHIAQCHHTDIVEDYVMKQSLPASPSLNRAASCYCDHRCLRTRSPFALLAHTDFRMLVVHAVSVDWLCAPHASVPGVLRRISTGLSSRFPPSSAVPPLCTSCGLVHFRFPSTHSSDREFYLTPLGQAESSVVGYQPLLRAHSEKRAAYPYFAPCRQT
jgi:hypothetical protein